jgi:hypothetical protein
MLLPDLLPKILGPLNRVGAMGIVVGVAGTNFSREAREGSPRFLDL